MNLNNVRLRGKMLILYFLSVFVPIVLTNLIFYQVTTHNVKKQKIKDISLVMEQTSNDFLAKIDVAVGISAVLYTDNTLNDALEKGYPGAPSYVDSYYTTVSGALNKYSPVYKAIKRIVIYTDNPTIIEGGAVLPITDEIQRNDWFQAISASKSSSPIISQTDVETITGPEKAFSVIRKLDYFTFKNTSRKILRIDIDMDAIREIFQNVTLQGNVYLLNDRNGVEYTTDPGVDWRNRQIPFEQVDIPADAIHFEQIYSDINYLRNWKIIGEVSEREVLGEVHQSRNFVIYMAIPNIVIPTLIIVWFARSLNTRLIRILRHMKKVKNRHFTTIPHEYYKDEIGQLTEEFNRMTLQIKKLIDDVYIADINRKNLEIKRNQAQLHALQSQINPHFLFNALETIRMRSLMKHENETAKIIQNMAKIFRTSLSWEKDWRTVREEIVLIQCFLEIQKYRFGDKLDYMIEVDEDAYDCLIPQMSVLPFVENASIHGIEQNKGSGKIELRFALRGRSLHYEVRDNGIGIPAEQLREMMEDLKQEDHMGDRIGIKNVYYRFRLHYGDAFDFDIRSGRDGTVVSVRLPVK